MNGRKKIDGARPTSDAVARTVAEPVSLVTHQMRANCAATEPTSDRDWPVQIVKNRVFHLSIRDLRFAPYRRRQKTEA